MYLGHLIFLFSLSLTFWSWLALTLLIGRACWFHRRVLRDEKRLEEIFGSEYVSYKSGQGDGFLEFFDTYRVNRRIVQKDERRVNCMK
jgi:protein-S-isoprenylcysteine O-methyltransferase Ste14